VTVSNVAGSSPVNRVTFMADNGNASSVDITHNAGTTFRLNSASYYTFKNLSFSNTSTSGVAMSWSGSLKRDSLLGCTLTTATSTSSSCMAFDAAPSGTGPGDGPTFIGNTFTGGYYTFRWNGGSSAAGAVYDFVFDDNTLNGT